MLAYELFLSNKNSTKNNPKKQFPIKKIFYKNNDAVIDSKTCEQYGSEFTRDTEQLQNWLQMPLNTIDVKELNLPDFRTGTRSANPYVEVYGKLETNNSLESKFVLSMGQKPNYINYTLDLASGEILNNFNGTVVLDLDREKYFQNSNTLFSEYIKSKIINDDGFLNMTVYDKIICKFLDTAKKYKLDMKKPGKIPFRVYILPDDSTIEFRKQTQKENSENITFTDYFGNTALEYASTPTKTAKFLSYDDPAFSINCTQTESFYKNLGIGSSSQEKIFTNTAQTFTINRLDWTFVDISNPDYKFKETKKGILTQLYENYNMLEKDKGDSSRVQLKVICIKSDQAKQELLIDENLTMDKMENMFYQKDFIPHLCLEKVLIDNSGKKPIWDTYLYVIKNILAGNKIPRTYLLSFFNKILKQKRYDWINPKNKSEPEEFFQRSDFCLKHFTGYDSKKYDDYQTDQV
ncbi:MAG: hypothetical protein IS860_11000 [Nitrosopumilus sp.]|nr:hypothetical protein [Nitrosopumilus sp.]